jgi:hypothetical protein
MESETALSRQFLEASNPVKRAAGIRDLYKNLEDNNGFPAQVGADGKSVELTPDQKMAKAAELYDANTAVARGAAFTAFPQQIAPQQAPAASAPILYSRPQGAAPAPTISDRSRAFWRDKGIIMPWWGAQPAAPVARGILETQAPPAHPAQGTSGRRSFLSSVGAALSGRPVVSENIDDLPFADRLPGRGANNGASLLDSIGAAVGGKPVVSENVDDLPFSNLIPGRAYVSEDISRLPHGSKRPVGKTN